MKAVKVHSGDVEQGGSGHDFDIYEERDGLEFLIGHIDGWDSPYWTALDLDGNDLEKRGDFDDLVRWFSWSRFTITLAPATD